jgi:glycosyltransferase involved in cell wall biosynthesis
MNKLSIVMPTLNCAASLPAHLEAMAPWLDLANEVVVVDSFSDDGTPQLIQDCLKHPNLRLLSHPRGLYQSWNHAIAQTTGDWIYISTIGDTITRPHLEHLLMVGKALDSDVVISPPSFTFADHIKMEPPVWPIAGLLSFHGIEKPTEISPFAVLYHGARVLPNAILGSSASNLYRGDHLRSRPFPTTFKSAGDAAWSLQFALETLFCFTPQQGSTFCFHSAHYMAQDPVEHAQLCDAMRAIVKQSLTSVDLSPEWAEITRLIDEEEMLQQTILETNRQLSQIRRASLVPWYFRKSALQYWAYRNRLIDQRRALIARHEEQVRQLPMRALG